MERVSKLQVATRLSKVVCEYQITTRPQRRGRTKEKVTMLKKKQEPLKKRDNPRGESETLNWINSRIVIFLRQKKLM